MMIRVALFAFVSMIVVGASVIVVGAIIIGADRLVNPAETPNETITSRFPEG